jgi:hypothetical protein
MTKLRKYIRRYISVSAVIDTLRRREIALLDPRSWDDRNDRYFLDLYKEKKHLSGLYALCAARCSETYHHWRVFTSGKEGACLELKRGPLEAALRTDDNIKFGPVDYLLLEKVDTIGPSDLERLPFFKRAGFAAEEEYRIIAHSDDTQAAALGIEIDLDWISKIYLNPWMPEPLAESVKASIRAIDGCKKIRIQRSHLIDNQRWKSAGDRVVGHPQPKAKLSLSLKTEQK